MIIGPKASSARRAISGRKVSSDNCACGTVSLNAPIAGATRFHSSSSEAGVLPGLVEHPPISRMSAPSASAARAHATIWGVSPNRDEA